MDRPTHDGPPDRVNDVHAATALTPLSAGTIDEQRAFLALATVRGIGQKTLFAMADDRRSFSEALEDVQVAPNPAGSDGKPLSERHWSRVRGHALEQGDRLAEHLEALGIVLLFRGSPGFPSVLLDLERPPH